VKRQDDTGFGPPGASFRTTIWTEILAIGDPSDPATRERLDRLLRAYWRPVFAYIRSAWRSPIEDAKDLTQAFFARFLEKEYWSTLDPEKGSFRGYLKRALKNFLINAKEHADARRPGGALFSLDASHEELQRLAPESTGEAPEAAYDREWFNGLMDAALEELGRLLKADGKAVYFDVFVAYCRDAEGAAGADPGEDAPTYQKIAADFRLQKHDVRNYLAHGRKTLRAILRERIREYVASDEDLERELNEVIGR
jgi:RNA polymerase sigma-70 factor (ECF subfamily)